jgi:hypothetical protein
MTQRHSTLVAILLGGLVAGTVDVFAASAINGFADPVRILKFIAAGVIGLPDARAGGAGVAVAGYVLQITMSMIIAAIYNIGAMALPVLRQRWLPAGIAFGVPVFLVMTYVVLPLSAAGNGMPPFTVKQAMNLIAMLVFGAIVGFFARAK